MRGEVRHVCLLGLAKTFVSPGRSRGHTADRQTFLGRARPLAPFGRRQARGALGGKGRPRDDATGGSYHLASLKYLLIFQNS
jgi:hypothetical protein